MCLYFLKGSSGFIKIGRSSNFDKRLSEIRRGTTDEHVEVLRVFYGDDEYIRARERELHLELSGAGAGVGNSAGQAITGDNPLSTENLKESGKIAATQAILSAPFEAVGGLPQTKLGRSMINQSLGAQTRDITYGNPAKALIDEGINDVATGDFEAYKDALRSGKTPAEASKAASGRFASVNQRIEEYGPRLEKVLSQSQQTIPVADAIDAPCIKRLSKSLVILQ